MTIATLTAVVALGSAACGDDDSGTGDGPYALDFHGHGYELHNMQALRVAIVDVAADQTIATDEVVVSDGSFAFHWPSLLEKDKSYHIDFYADTDASGTCGGADHIWRELIPAVAYYVSVVYTHGIIFEPLACDSF